MSSLRDSRYWDRQNEMGLPDSRVSGMSRERSKVFINGQWKEPVYCANCGVLEGYVTAEWTPHAFAVCNACLGLWGEPPGAIRID